MNLVGVDLNARPARTDLSADPLLPAETRLWAALQDVGGGVWGGCVFDTDEILRVLEAGKKSDAQTMAMSSGKANVMDVVTAVAETDVAVSTLVSVRDRVIQSYEDIMKMPI